MKITKRELRRIIKEEKQKLNEGSIDDVAKEMAKVIDQIGSHRFAYAAMHALGDEATEKGLSIVSWVKRQYGLEDSPSLPKPKRKTTRRVGTSRDGLTPR